MPTIQITLTPTSTPAPGSSVVAHTTRTTFYDAIQHVTDFFGADPGAEMGRIARRAILAALREITNAHNWSYLYAHGRLNTHGFYTTGTIQFQATSGPQPNYVTLTGGTFPSWTNLGSMRFGSSGAGGTVNGTVIYDVDQLIDSTHCTLLPSLAPTVDFAAGTSFTLFQDTYTLPEDFVAADQGFADVSWGGMEYVHPNQWLRVNRYYQSYSNVPRYFTIRGDPKSPNRLCWSIFPYPDLDRTLDFIYKRRSRKLQIDSYSTGTVTVDAVNTPQTITGTGTAWTANMAGSVIRLGNAAPLGTPPTNLPTDLAGSNPAAMERNAKTIVSATSITADDLAAASLTGVAYQISDPIDVENGAMLDAFFRCCEKHAGIQRSHKNLPIIIKMYEEALIQAREADSRVFAQRVAGLGGPYRQRLARMPAGPDVS